MENTTARHLIELFLNHGVVRPLDRFVCYLHALIAVYIHEDGQYSDYYTAWCSPNAKSLRKYLDCLKTFRISLDRTFFNSLAAYTSEGDAKVFVAEVAAGLFTGSLDSVFSCIRYESAAGIRNEIYALLRLLAVLEVRTDLIWKGTYPARQDRLQPDGEYRTALYSEFTAWKNYDVYSKLIGLDEAGFFQLWMSAFGIDFRPEPIRIQHSISGALKKLRGEGVSDEEILRLFFIARVYSHFDSKRIAVPLSYLKTALLSGSEHLPFTKSPGAHFFGDEVLLNRTLEGWRGTDTVDFIRALYFADAPKNIAAENLIVYPQLGPLFNSSATGLIVEPNPDFVAKLMGDERISHDRLVIAFLSLDLAQVYKERFPDGQFAFLTVSETSDASLLLQVADENSHKKKPEYISEPFTSTFSFVNVFFRPWLESTFPSILASVCRWTTDRKSKVNIYVPHSQLDRPMQNIRAAIRANYSLVWAILFPKDSTSDWLKKNLLLSLVPIHSGEQSRDLLIFRASLFQEQQRDVICQDPWPVRVPVEEVLAGEKTINYLWDRYRPKPPQGKSRTTRYYDFSDEIRIWYSWSKGRGRFHFYECPTEKKLRKNPLNRGKKLASVQNCSAPDTQAMELKIEQTLLDTDKEWQACIKKEIISFYRNKPISLKTFWYCRLDELEKRPVYRASVAEDLLSSTALAALRSDRPYTLEDYRHIMEESFSDRSQSEQVQLWRQLNLILSLAAKERRFSPNPVSEYTTSLLEQDKGYRAARAALVKKSYSLSEERKMLDYMKNRAKEDVRYLGCLISFYTGMTNGEICALTWSDYRSTAVKGLAQLMVYKTMQPNGSIQPLTAEEPYRFRRVPCAYMLTALLNERKKLVEAQLKNDGQVSSVGALAKLPIVFESNSALSVPCKQSALKKAKDAVEQAAGIEMLQGSVVYEDDSEQVTDFNDYRADRFRANFRYRASQTCLMSKAELNYILGISPPTTFSKHYCDYTNDLAQALLCRKLARWADRQEQRVPNGAHIVHPNKGGEFRATFKGRSCLTLALKADSEDSDSPAQLSLEVSVPRGADIGLYLLEQ